MAFSKLDALVKLAFAVEGIGAARLPVRSIGAVLNSSLGDGKPGDEDNVNIVLDCCFEGVANDIVSAEAMAEGRAGTMRLLLLAVKRRRMGV